MEITIRERQKQYWEHKRENEDSESKEICEGNLMTTSIPDMFSEDTMADMKTEIKKSTEKKPSK